MTESIKLAQGPATTAVLLQWYASSHGRITGWTDTGKTRTWQVMVEPVSSLTTTVFVADVNGDLQGIAQTGQPALKLTERLRRLGFDEPQWGGASVEFWDI